MLMIHGSAADHTTWSIQSAGPLASQFSLIAYDRHVDGLSVEAYADAAVAQLADDPEPAIVVGSSFGSVIALDAIRRYPERFRGAVLMSRQPSSVLARANSR